MKRVTIIIGSLLLLIFLAACRTGEAIPTPTREAPLTPSATAYAVVTPTAQPTLPPQTPPRVLKHSPASGEEIGLDGAIEIIFDQPMDRSSVEKAFSLAPAVAGQFRWVDDRTVTFLPADGKWQRDATYKVTLAGSAQSITQKAMGKDLTFRFRTVGYLEVVKVWPQPDSQDVSSDTSITIVFNRPVVPLTSLEKQEDLPQPFEANPPIPGQGTWINTSLYQFTPSEKLRANALYTLTVPANLEAVGGQMAEDYVWSFQVEPLRAELIFPMENATLVAPSTTITLTFNQEMDTASVEERFSLLEAETDTPISGSFVWEGTAMRFTPAQPLERGATYVIRLAPGARAAVGDALIEEESRWRFQVAPRPAVAQTVPPANAQGVNLWDPLRIAFTAPMDPKSVESALVITPALRYMHVSWGPDTTELWIYGELKPSTRYTITLSTEARDRFGEPLIKPLRWNLETSPLEPNFYLVTQGPIGIYSAYTQSSLEVHTVNVSRLDFALYTLTPADLISLTRDGGWPNWDLFKPRDSDLIARWSIRVSGPQNETQSVKTTLAPNRPQPLASGIYMLKVTGLEARNPQYHIMVVTPMNVTLKASPTEALIWVTDLRDGKPLEGVQVVLYGAKGQVADEGYTDADGLLMLNVPRQERWESLLAIAYTEDGIGAVGNTWNEGISPWLFNLPVAWEIRTYAAHVVTDRRIYRPGQTVYFKAFVRRDDDGRYSLPPVGTSLEATLLDPFGREVWRGRLSLSEWGSVDEQIPLSEDATLGYYSLLLRCEGQTFETGFQVAEYRKPEFQVTVNLVQEECIAGEPLQAEVEATYFFGGAVAEANVLWRVFGEMYSFDRYTGEAYYSFSDWNQDGSAPLDLGLLTEGHGRTDVNGRLVFTVPTTLEGFQSRRFVLQVSVIDINNQEVTGQDSAIVHKGGLYIGLRAEHYVGTAGQPMPIHVLTVDTQGQALGRQTVEVVVARQEWYSVQQQGADGAYYWENKVRSTPIFTETVVTDRQGSARIIFTPPEGGTYKVAARAQDEAQNEVRSGLYVWVSDREFINWGQQNHSRIELVPDKKAYEPGETASILVPSPFDGPVTALLTIERGHILEYRLIRLETNSDILEIPILSEYAPNVFVSVVLVRGVGDDPSETGYRVGYVMLPVSPKEHALTVRITPDRDTSYQPRETVTFTIEVQDHRGAPVEAEIAVQMVDLAVETLVGGAPPDIMTSFYRERGLAITTALSLARRRPPQAPEVDREGKGGGGGEGEGMRTEFPDTALWMPSVHTGPDGRATVSVTLPDNLTTWRIRAQAITRETLVGQGQTDIVSNLAVMVRPMAPRFLVVGDEPVLGAVVHNNTSEDLTFDVSLNAQGLTVQNPEQNVPVNAGERQVVQWLAVVEPGDWVTLTFAARGGGYQDAIQITLLVLAPTAAEVIGTSGIVQEEVIEAVRIPTDAAPSQGGLTLQLEPSLAAAIQESIKYLKTFPYGCAEQTVSSFLPNIAFFRALDELGVKDPVATIRLAREVATALQRLYALQNPDGGWGWWGGETSSPLITAYVVQGMAEARGAGFTVDTQVLERAIDFLYQWLNEAKPADRDAYDTRAAVLYALAEAGQGDLARTVALFEKRDQLSLFAQAYLGMALHLLEPEEPARVQMLENEWTDAAILSAAGAHWEDPEASPWQMNTDIRTTAMVLRALLWISPEHSLLPQGVRWLMMARTSGRWETTQENVWAILALTDYMAATGETKGDYHYAVSLNGMERLAGRVTPTEIFTPASTFIPMEELPQGQDAYLAIERTPATAPGRLYYSAFLKYYLPIENLEALDRGIILYREYRLADDPDSPITSAKINDLIEVRLTLIAPRDLYYLIVEDPYPAGCEPLDPTLAISRRTMETWRGLVPEEAMEWKWWFDWYTHTEMRDEKLVLSTDALPRGTYTYTYLLRCTTPGTFRVIPAMAYQMYEPDIFGRTGGMLFTIR